MENILLKFYLLTFYYAATCLIKRPSYILLKLAYYLEIIKLFHQYVPMYLIIKSLFRKNSKLIKLFSKQFENNLEHKTYLRYIKKKIPFSDMYLSYLT